MLIVCCRSEIQLQMDSNASSECIPNTEQAIDFLHKYEFILQRKTLSADLHLKHGVIFQVRHPQHPQCH